MKLKLNKVLFLVWLMFFSNVVLAQTGSLKIYITNQEEKPIKGALIEISSKDNIVKNSNYSDHHGHAIFIGLVPSKKYSIKISKDGYHPYIIEGTTVSSDQRFNVEAVLQHNTAEIERIDVVARKGLADIDLSSSTTGVSISLDLTDSLPTKRDYQSYLELAPGVKPSISGNPSSKSGTNYTEFGGTIGSSTDNIYLLDGINVTNNQSGGFGSNINSEIIQELRVITGGVPAEFEGGTGLISQVVTKSGSNEFHGSINYYLQNDHLMADHENLVNNRFSSFDTAITLGGPIIKDSLWFFASVQEKRNKLHLTDLNSQSLLRTVEEDSTMSFLKLTWHPSQDGLFTFSFFDDPTTKSGQTDPLVINKRDSKKESGGKNYKLEYTHDLINSSASIMYARHESDNNIYAKDKSSANDVLFRRGTNPKLEEISLGGMGFDRLQITKREELHLSLEHLIDTQSFGFHHLKLGYSNVHNQNNQMEFMYMGAKYNSLSNNHSGITLNDFTNSNWIGRVNISQSAYPSIISTMLNSDQRNTYLDLFDIDEDGQISESELGDQLTFSSTEGNPNQQTNLFRTYTAQNKPVDLEVKGQTWFIQDSIDFDRLYVTVGLRGERWEHFDSNGSSIATFGWDTAHRFNISYDLLGDGSTKVWYFNGKYLDPIRTNMTYFVGNVSGPNFEDQIFINDHWMTFRYRGGSQASSGIFSPNIKTPYTTEHLIGLKSVFADDMSIELTYSKRKTKNLIEDIIPNLYTNDSKNSDFYLPPSYFGLSDNQNLRFVMANLVGAERDYEGFEITFHKHRSTNWNFAASYTYGDANGNSNSDGNVDFQGDFIWLDPRAPNVYGNLPGSITHLFKAYGTYFFNNGIELGFVYNWNSGTKYNKSWLFAGRHLPVLSEEPYNHGGIVSRWVNKSAVGGYTTPSYGSLNIRLKYNNDCLNLTCEFFLDIFNITDNQAVIQEQGLASGDGTYQFGEGINWLQSRRLYLGTRISF